MPSPFDCVAMTGVLYLQNAISLICKNFSERSRPNQRPNPRGKSSANGLWVLRKLLIPAYNIGNSLLEFQRQIARGPWRQHANIRVTKTHDKVTLATSPRPDPPQSQINQSLEIGGNLGAGVDPICGSPFLPPSGNDHAVQRRPSRKWQIVVSRAFFLPVGTRLLSSSNQFCTRLRSAGSPQTA